MTCCTPAPAATHDECMAVAVAVVAMVDPEIPEDTVRVAVDRTPKHLRYIVADTFLEFAAMTSPPTPLEAGQAAYAYCRKQEGV